MKPNARRQVKIRMSGELSLRVKKYCAAHNVTETALMNRALEQCLTGADQHSLLMRRLDLLAHEIARVSVAVEMLGEMMGTFVQLWFAHNPELPGAQKANARRDALRRHGLFVEHILSGVTGGRTLLARLTGPAEPPSDRGELEAARVRAGRRMQGGGEAETSSPSEAMP
jgi:hypothetical protein